MDPRPPQLLQILEHTPPAVQPSLFDNPPAREAGRARRRDPETAKKAAAAVRVGELEGLVLGRLRSHGGMTTHELAAALSVDLVSISPRMRPLVEKGLARDSGERRRGESGRASIVWKAVYREGADGQTNRAS
jgi:hypothetical protein